jgi:hypothetical protein
MSNYFNIVQLKIIDTLTKAQKNISLSKDIKIIETAFEKDSHNLFLMIVLDIDIEKILPERYLLLDNLFSRNADRLSQENQEKITKWLEPLARIRSDRFITTLDSFADRSLLARSLCEELIPKMSPQIQQYQQAKLLRFVPISEHSPLASFDKKSQLFLVCLYGKQIGISIPAFRKLLEVSKEVKSKKGAYDKVVLKALKYIENEEIPDKYLKIEELTPLLKSNFAKARIVSLKLISQISPNLSEEQLSEICYFLKEEEDQQVAIYLCKLVKYWVNKHHCIPSNVPEAIGTIPSRLIAKSNFDGGVAEVLIPTMTAIAQRNNQILNKQQLQQLVEWTRTLLKAIDIGRGKSRENVIYLILAIQRLDENFLLLLVNDDCIKFAENKWEENLCAVAQAIQHTKRFSLLSKILDLARNHNLSKVEAVALRAK